MTEEEDLEAILLRDLAELDNPSVYADPRYSSYGNYGDEVLPTTSSSSSSAFSNTLLQLGTTNGNTLLSYNPASHSVLTMVADALQDANHSTSRNKPGTLSDAWTTYLHEIQQSHTYINSVQESAIQLTTYEYGGQSPTNNTNYNNIRTSPIITTTDTIHSPKHTESDSKLNEAENIPPILSLSPPSKTNSNGGGNTISFADYYMPGQTSLAATAAAIAASVLKDDKEALQAINAAVQHANPSINNAAMSVTSTSSVRSVTKEKMTNYPPLTNNVSSPPKSVNEKLKFSPPSYRPSTPLSSASSNISSPSTSGLSAATSAIAQERARVITETETLRSRPGTASRGENQVNRTPNSVSSTLLLSPTVPSSPYVRTSPSKTQIVVPSSSPHPIVVVDRSTTVMNESEAPSITFDLDFQTLQQQWTEQANTVLAQEREYRKNEMELQRLKIKEEEEKLENHRKALQEAAAMEAYRREIEKAKAAEAAALRMATNAANRLQAVAKGFIIRRRTKLHILIETARQEKARQEAERQRIEREAREVALLVKMQEEARIEAERARQAYLQAQAAEAARLEAIRRAEEERRQREEEAIRVAAELAYQRQLAAEAAEAFRKQQEMERKEKERRDKVLELQRMNEEDQLSRFVNRRWREEYQQRKERFLLAQEDYLSYQVRIRWKRDAEEKERRKLQQRQLDQSSMTREDKLSVMAERTYRLGQIFGGKNIGNVVTLHNTSPSRRRNTGKNLPPSPIQAWRETSNGNNNNQNLIGNLRSRIHLAQQQSLSTGGGGGEERIHSSPSSPSSVKQQRRNRTSSSNIASKLQAIWKGKRERKNPMNPYNQYKQFIIQQQVQELYYLATRIQCIYRGYRVRKAVKTALEQARYQDMDNFQYNEIDLNEFLGGPIPDDLLEPEKFPSQGKFLPLPGPTGSLSSSGPFPPPFMMGTMPLPLPPPGMFLPPGGIPGPFPMPLPGYMPPSTGHNTMNNNNNNSAAYRPGMLAVAMERQSQSQQGNNINNPSLSSSAFPSPPRFSPLVPPSAINTVLLPHHQRPLTGTSILTETLSDNDNNTIPHHSNYPVPTTRNSNKSRSNDDNDTWELQSIRSDTQLPSTPYDRPPTAQSFTVSPSSSSSSSSVAVSIHGGRTSSSYPSHVPSSLLANTNNGLTKIPPMNPMAVAAVEAEWGVTDPHIAELILRRRHKIHHAARMGSKVQFRALEKAARSAAALAGHGGVIVGTGGFSYPTTTTSASHGMLPANSSFVDRIRGTVHGGRHHGSSNNNNGSNYSNAYPAHSVTSTGMKMSRLPSVQDNLPDHLRPGGGRG